MSRKPLIVRVAERLGCLPEWLEAEPFYPRPAGWYCGCDKQCPFQWEPSVGFVAGGLISAGGLLPEAG